MDIRSAYLFELDPNDRQKTAFVRASSLARIVWNWGLAARKNDYETRIKPARERGEKPKAMTPIGQMTAWRAVSSTVAPWSAEFSAKIPNFALIALGHAYQTKFAAMKAKRHAGWPRFKAKGKCRQSFTVTDSIHVHERSVDLPKMGSIRVKGRTHRVEGRITSATVSEKAGRWFISIKVERAIPDPVAPIGEAIGIDVGVRTALYLSTGEKIDAPRPLKASLVKLRKAQKAVARSQRNSGRRKRKVARVARIHARAANIRRNWQHETSDRLTRTYPVIGREDLAVKNLMHRKRHLGRSWADLGIAELFRQIDYKAAWRGGTVVVADRFYPSSQLCSTCGHRQPMPLHATVYDCGACGLSLDRDLNAARNLRTVAVMPTETQNARGGDVSPGRKTRQSPAKREPSYAKVVTTT